MARQHKSGLPTNIEELVGALQALSELAPVERVRRARLLAPRALRVIAAAGDEATVEALEEIVGKRPRTYADLAKLLGVSTDRINHAVTAHRKRAEKRTT